MGKKEMSARFASSKVKKGKSKSNFSRQVPSTVDSAIGFAPQEAQATRPAPAPPAAFSRPVRRSWAPTRAAKGPGLVTDYSYVSNDLKRIAITAASMLAILAALSLVIR